MAGTDRFFIFADGGSTYQIMGREYENALVIAKFTDTAGFANIGNNPTTHPLPGAFSFRRLNEDNSLGPVISEITLGYGEGAILIKGPDSCSGTDTSCGVFPSCENCNLQDGCYTGEYRDYYCNIDVCEYVITTQDESNGNGNCGDGIDNDCDGQTDSDDTNCLAPGCYLSDTAWQNNGISPQSEAFTAEFDATPNNDNMDGLIALSDNPGVDYSDFAVLVRFAVSGNIDAMNDTVYDADIVMPYSTGTEYHFRLEIDVVNHTYDVFVTPEGQSEQQLADDYLFRDGQQGIVEIDNWAYQASI